MPDGVVEIIVRWGGWQAVTGARTVLRIYARNALDKFVDPYALSLGFALDAKGVQQRMEEYLGKSVFPSKPIRERGREFMPAQIRLQTYQSAAWLHFQQAMNEVCQAIMEAACNDKEIWPIRRYTEYREAFTTYLKLYKDGDLAVKYAKLKAERQARWKQCLTATVRHCRAAFVRSKPVGQAHKLLKQMYLSLLMPVVIGGVDLYQHQNPVSLHDWDPNWDRKGHFYWRVGGCEC